jgi:hypothetical protein
VSSPAAALLVPLHEDMSVAQYLVAVLVAGRDLAADPAAARAAACRWPRRAWRCLQACPGWRGWGVAGVRLMQLADWRASAGSPRQASPFQHQTPPAPAWSAGTRGGCCQALPAATRMRAQPPRVQARPASWGPCHPPYMLPGQPFWAWSPARTAATNSPASCSTSSGLLARSKRARSAASRTSRSCPALRMCGRGGGQGLTGASCLCAGAAAGPGEQLARVRGGGEGGGLVSEASPAAPALQGPRRPQPTLPTCCTL